MAGELSEPLSAVSSSKDGSASQQQSASFGPQYLVTEKKTKKNYATAVEAVCEYNEVKQHIQNIQYIQLNIKNI